jgi:hypothetical protein
VEVGNGYASTAGQVTAEIINRRNLLVEAQKCSDNFFQAVLRCLFPAHFRSRDTGAENFDCSIHNWPALHLNSVRDRLIAFGTPGIRMTRQNLSEAFQTAPN